jgi:hypothetical protein
MPTLTLHHYQDHKQPYVAKIVRDEQAGRPKQVFLPKTQTKRSQDGSFGDFQINVDQEGFYRIGNAQAKENGYRIYFKTQRTHRFPFIRHDPAIAEIKHRIQLGQSIETIVHEMNIAAGTFADYTDNDTTEDD